MIDNIRIATNHQFPEATIESGSRYDATFPEVVKDILAQEFDPEEIAQMESSLRAYPALTWQEVANLDSTTEVKRATDIYTKLLPFLEDPECLEILEGLLQTIDFTIGCVPRKGSDLCCSTCLADSPPFLRLMSFDSIMKLVADPRFRVLLRNSCHLRIGSGADPLDHPQIAEIVTRILELIELEINEYPPIEYPFEIYDRSPKLVVFSTFRPMIVERYYRLAEIARRNKLLDFAISLPLNADSAANEEFTKHPDLEPFAGNDVQAIGKLCAISNDGRILSPKHPQMEGIPSETSQSYYYYGTCKVFVNPDGLWIYFYLPRSNTHTGRGFLHITDPEVLKRLSKVLPYNKDFDVQNWPARHGADAPRLTQALPMGYQSYLKLYQEYLKSGYCKGIDTPKPPIYVEC